MEKKEKTSEELKVEDKLLREMLDQKREAVKKYEEKPVETIPKKVAAVEAHKHIITGRNIGVIGIGALILSLMVMLIHNIAGTVTAMVGVGILGWYTVMRSRTASYLEQKYGITPKPIVNKPTAPQDLPGFKGV